MADLTHNQKVTAGQTAMGTTGAILSAIPTPFTMIAGAGLGIGSSLLGLAKKPDDIGVDPNKEAALGVSAANMDRISSINGMSQRDVGNIATLADRSRAEGLAAINSAPVGSLLDRQRIGQALMQHTQQVDRNIQTLIDQLDPAAEARNATATANAANVTSNIASDINREKRLERDHAEATRAAQAKSVKSSLVSFTKALNQQLDWMKDDADNGDSMSLLDNKELEKPETLNNDWAYADVNKTLDTPLDGYDSPFNQYGKLNPSFDMGVKLDAPALPTSLSFPSDAYAAGGLASPEVDALFKELYGQKDFL